MPTAILADRDPDTRDMYGVCLGRLGWSVEQAEDGQAALQKAISTLPDLVITETRLPGLSGYDLCRHLRQDPATCDIPILVVTADQFVSAPSRPQATWDMVLIKPALPDQLTAAIGRLFDKRVWTFSARSKRSEARGAAGSRLRGLIRSEVI